MNCWFSASQNTLRPSRYEMFPRCEIRAMRAPEITG
jgi:hypothetical protein